MVPSGIMSPVVLLRTQICPMSSGFRRKSDSAWTYTRKSRPNRLKSFT
jgi:hypothetical protein